MAVVQLALWEDGAFVRVEAGEDGDAEERAGAEGDDGEVGDYARLGGCFDRGLDEYPWSVVLAFF